MSPADLERLYKLWRQLSEELDPPSSLERATTRLPDRSPEHTAAVLEALRETGALQALGLTAVEPRDDDGGEPR
jgi:hypothetical protein